MLNDLPNLPTLPEGLFWKLKFYPTYPGSTYVDDETRLSICKKTVKQDTELIPIYKNKYLFFRVFDRYDRIPKGEPYEIDEEIVGSPFFPDDDESSIWADVLELMPFEDITPQMVVEKAEVLLNRLKVDRATSKFIGKGVIQ